VKANKSRADREISSKHYTLDHGGEKIRAFYKKRMSKMRKIFATIGAIAALPLLWSNTATAQEADAPRFVPVEVFSCNYVKGKSYKDLQRVIDKWNKWMDENGAAAYTAWTITPDFSSGGKYEMDVGWVGAWADGKAMGASQQKSVFGDGAAMIAEFSNVVDCPMHSSSASVNIKEPMGWPSKTSVTIFSDCKVAEGKTVVDAFAMEQAWSEQMSASGSKAGTWLWYPGWGLGDIDYDYKRVIGHPDYPSTGADFESFTNGRGYEKAAGIFAGSVSCDSPRVYSTHLVRDGGVPAR
jgi:hypothetical protein